MKQLSFSRLVVWLCVVDIVAAAFTLTRRIRLPEEIGDAASVFNGLLMGIPFYLALVYLVYERYPDSRFSALLNRVTDRRVVVPVVAVVMVVPWFLYCAGVPYTTGSWPSMSMLAAGILVIYLSVCSRVPSFVAVALSVGIMGIWTGVWEIPYQTMLRVVYELPQIGNEAFIRIGWEWVIEILTAGYGIYLAIRINKRYRVIQVGKTFWVFLALCTGAIVYWAVTGYWCDDYYDWSANEWVRTPGFDRVALFMAKVSKTFFLLGLLSIVKSEWRVALSGGGERLCRLW